MTSDMLQKARDLESRQDPRTEGEDRPAFHVTPTVGWMNDPNGFSTYKGEYTPPSGVTVMEKLTSCTFSPFCTL